MKRILLTSIITTMMTISSFAVESGDTCDENTLQSTDGTVELRGTWSGNTVNLNWYNGNEVFYSNTCNYGGNIDLPTVNPVRQGYQFLKWRRKTCLTALNVETDGYAYADKNPDGTCFFRNADTEEKTEDCSDAVFSDMNNGEWKTMFDYGIVRGDALCSSSRAETNDVLGIPDENTTGQYCWCRATEFLPTVGESCEVTAMPWMYAVRYDKTTDCLNRCSYRCAYRVRGYIESRSPIFGQN